MNTTRQPNRFRWPLIIIGALVVHVCGTLYAVSVATTARGGDIVPDYYAKAVNWDRDRAPFVHAFAIGLKLDLTISPNDADSKLVRATIIDSSGSPIKIDSPHIDANHTAFVNATDSITPAADATSLAGPMKLSRNGFWNFTVSGTLDGKPVAVTKTVWVQ